MEIHAVLINLRRSPDRLEFQRQQLARLGIRFERLEAVDGQSISDLEFRTRSRHWLRPLGRNEIGCFLSHRLAWQRVVAEQRPMLILEDDVVLSDNLTAVLAGLTLSKESAVYNLETTIGRKLLSLWTTDSLPLGYCTRKIHRDSGGSGAYVIAPKMAEICLKRAERHTAPSDAFLNAMPRLQIEPALALQIFLLPAQLKGDLRTVCASTIARTTDDSSPLHKLVRRPRMKLRRLISNLQTIALQARTLGRARKRWVPYCPTIDCNAKLKAA